MAKRSWGEAAVILVGSVVVIAASVVLADGRTGTDESARAVVEAEQPAYVPWAAPVRTNTPKQERALFVLQGGLGAAGLAMAVWALHRMRSRRAPD